MRPKLALEDGATKNNNTPAAASSTPVTLMARAICNATDFIYAPPFTERRKGLELHLGNDLTSGRGKSTRLVGRHLALQQGESQEQYWSCHSKMRVSGLCKARSCVCKSRLRAEINGVEVNPVRNSGQDLQFNETITKGIPHQAGKRIQIELHKNSRTMVLHRLYADIQNG